ncbi:acyl-CoA Delta(11) desaturase-like [Drosophila miranda]|uniref:acyl-CoA Delta(11) desaturase-like n=1 Tax=Drosophila miranda TaxID=7229 RepID=UPI0007E64900|nr:acyl-CoA Delta(11) desaturase-like [Drosophila miranda]
MEYAIRRLNMPPNIKAQAKAEAVVTVDSKMQVNAGTGAGGDAGEVPFATSNGVLFEGDEGNQSFQKCADGRKVKLVWRNILAFGYLHLAAIYGLYLLVTSAKWVTIGFAFVLYVCSGLGITAGAHRLWAHRSYKAKWQLRLLLVIFNTIAFQDAAYHWARDHRVHHKFSETDADPHNATRGFFFSHIGWLLCKKHPEVKAKGQGIDLSDLRADPILMFQKRYYLYLMPFACFVLPTMIPIYFWDESIMNAWFVATMFRWCFILNVTWLVNSAAHKFGGRPYDQFISPTQNISVAVLAFGEGWHNYHHVFPWDYKTAELGFYSLNFTTFFIDCFSKIGWAYDLKTVSPAIIEKRVKRTGDGTHPTWGWGDKDQPKEEIEEALIMHRKQD